MRARKGRVESQGRAEGKGREWEGPGGAARNTSAGAPETPWMGGRRRREKGRGGGWEKMRQDPRDTFSNRLCGEGPACLVSPCPDLPSTTMRAFLMFSHW